MKPFFLTQDGPRAFSAIALGAHFRKHNGEILLSADLATEREVDEAIDRLIGCLEVLRISAKLACRQAKE